MRPHQAGAPRYVIIGCFTVDNVISAGGDRRADIPGGNVLWAAAGAHMWDSEVGLVGRAGTNFPPAALDRLSGAGLDLAGVTRVEAPGLRVAFAYEADGSRTRQVPERILSRIPDTSESTQLSLPELDVLTDDSIELRPRKGNWMWLVVGAVILALALAVWLALGD